MKSFLTRAALLILLFLPTSAFSQSTKPLAQLGVVDVVIEDLDQFEESLGISSTGISNRITIDLRRDLPKLKIESGATAYIRVSITCLPASIGAACAVQFELRRLDISIFANSAGVANAVAPVWQKGSLLVGTPTDMASRISNNIDQDMTAMAAKFYQDNP